MYELINSAIVEEPPISVRDGGIIKEGYSKEADELRDAKIKGKEWLSELEIREKERTGIKTLKVKYNKVFGYYLEVTNSFKDKVPPEWVRKQTLTNAERYTTDELKHLEDVILGAEDKPVSYTHLNDYAVYSSSITKDFELDVAEFSNAGRKLKDVIYTAS